MAMPRRPPRHHNLNSSAGLSTAASALILSADRPFAGGRPNWPPLEARSFAPHLPRTAAGRTRRIHSRDDERIETLAHRAKVCRVLVNQAHCIGNGGDFVNGLDFTLSLAAGTWGGNSTSDNITYKHFLNITRLSRPIAAEPPTEADLFGNYWGRFGITP